MTAPATPGLLITDYRLRILPSDEVRLGREISELEK